MLTRSQFDTACKGLVYKYTDSTQSFSNCLKGWSWNEHASVSGLGYLSRTAIHSRRSDSSLSCDTVETDLESLDDIATANFVHDERITSIQYVVYSATFQVPAFYFIIHDSNGSPLPLRDLIQTSLFHRFAFAGTETTSFALSLPTSSFPLLSQGDHLTLGTPCWYFHPCETAASVDEIMSEVGQDGWTEDMWLVRWLEAWFMVLGSIIDLET